jgi:pyrroloquinoline quinone biosynthesis protein D
VTAPARPRLARRARLRRDRRCGRDFLLYPERGLALSQTASEVLALCDGTRTLDTIVATLHARYPDALREVVARDVAALIEVLAARRLVEEAP